MALSFDPQALPILGIDDHLPAVAGGELLSESLRRRFADLPEWSPEIKTEHRFTERTPAHASVLIGLVPRNEIMVLLTQRTDHLDRKSTRLNSSHIQKSRMPSSA